MSRASVRTGIAAFLTGVTGINTVFSAFPQLVPGTAFTAGAAPGSTSGAVLVVFIDADLDKRISFGGTRDVTHSIELHLYHRSTKLDAAAAEVARDAVLDALKVKLRSDVTLGGAVTAAAVDDLAGDYGEPLYESEVVELWCKVAFGAREIF